MLENKGNVKSEFNLGTDKELKYQYKQMVKFPELEHDVPRMVTITRGKSGVVIWKFTTSRNVVFAYLLAWHYDAGTKEYIEVGSIK